jgi:hypothetical protein
MSRLKIIGGGVLVFKKIVCCFDGISLQRYLMKYLVKAPFPVREIGTVMTLLHACHVPEDLIRMEDFQGQHHFQ